MQRIKKEIEFLEKMFVGVDDENKKTLINSLIEEAAFLKVACFQAERRIEKRGPYNGNRERITEICKSPPLNPNLREIFTPIYRQLSTHSLSIYRQKKKKKWTVWRRYGMNS